jgi:hypothetical protein
MSGTSVATFQGQFNNPTVVVEDPTDPGNPNGNCPQQTPADEIDSQCGHYHLNVGTATGTITVTINFDASSVDLDLCVVDAANKPVGGAASGCSQGVGSSESVTISLNQCVDPHFEAHILPIDIGLATPLTPVSYTGTVTSNLTFCGGGANGNPTIDPTLPPVTIDPTVPPITANPSDPLPDSDGRHLATAGPSDVYSLQSPCTALGTMLSGGIYYHWWS